MRVVRTPVADALPFTLSEVLDLVRVDAAESEAEVARMAAASVLEIEHYAGLAFLHQSIRVDLDEWPDRRVLALPVGPVDPAATVTITADGEPFTGFELLYGYRPALRLTGDAPLGSLVIAYQAGFGDRASDVPTDLRLAVLQQTAAHYDLRGATEGKLLALSPHAARIAASYRRVAL